MAVSPCVPQAFASPSGALSYSQLEQLWVCAGGSAATAGKMASIALAESGGRPGAVSPTNDYGIWQVNAQAHPQYSTASLLDPLSNAQAAVAISGNGTNVGPWCSAWANPSMCNQSALSAPQAGSPAAKYAGPSFIAGTAAGGYLPLTQSQASGGTWLGHQLSDCALPLPFGTCLLNYGQVRAFMGGALIVAGGLVFLVGIGIVVAFGLKSSNPLQKVAPTKLAATAVRSTRAKRATRRSAEAAEAARTQEREASAARRRYAQGAGSKPRSRPMDERPFEESDRTLRKAS